MELTVKAGWAKPPQASTWSLSIGAYSARVVEQGDRAEWWVLVDSPDRREIANGSEDTPGDAKNAAEVAIHRHNNG